MTEDIITNTELAELLRDVAASLKITDEDRNKFRIIAYERAADAIEHLSSEAKDLWDEGKLGQVSGIGESLEKHLGELFKTGKSVHFNRITNKYPKAMYEMMKVPGIGAKTAYKICKEFKIVNPSTALERLKQLSLKGMINKKFLSAINEVEKRQIRLLLPYAEEIAQEAVLWLKNCSFVEDAEVLGSLRRRASTIGDIDIAVVSSSPNKIIDHFIKFPKIKRVIDRGEKSASIYVTNKVQIDIKVTDRSSYGSMLQHFTGSKHHNIALREHALKRNLSLSEYGIRKLSKGINTPSQEGLNKNNYNPKRKIFEYFSEKEFYNALGLSYIPPELREDSGEIQAALSNSLPKLIDIGDIKSDLHLHSDFNIETSHDLGQSSMEEMCHKADELGYEYIALTEHNPSHSGHFASQIESLITNKKKMVEQINTTIVKNGYHTLKHVFNCLEIDILSSGQLPLGEDILNLLDFALVSIHSSFTMNKEQMTKRVLAGLSHPKVKIFAHPSGRLLNEREGIELDWDLILNFCLKENKYLEINADPKRLDLPDDIVRTAIRKGVKLVLGTDSHYKENMNGMKYAVSVARRGWAERKDILNTYDLNEFKKMIL